MVVRIAQKARARRAALHPAIENVVRADLERLRAKFLALVVVEYDVKPTLRVAFDRFDNVGRILDGYRRAFLGDLEIEAAVGVLPDAAAEEQRDARVVDPLVVALPVAVPAKRDFARLDGVETCPCHLNAPGCPG